jgi:uncharacterized membrane protein HdeD (DUF308 family)
MLEALVRNWWLLLLRGIAAIAFGIMAFAWPALSLLTLVIMFGAYALVDGAISIGAALGNRGGGVPRWWLMIAGIAGIAAGLMTFFWPGLSALILLTFIAGWAIAHGVFQIVTAIQLRKVIDNEWLLILGGVLSVAFGIVMLVSPGAGALALIWVVAGYAIAYGVLLVAFSVRLRRHATV